MEEKILIAGSGGQGLMFLGKLLCLAGMKENKNVTFIPSYGAEMRGGTAHCFVRISDEKIASPIFDKFTTLFAFNKQSWEKFSKRAEKKSFIIVNNSLFSPEKISPVKVARLPLSDLAIKIGSSRVLNMIALGFFLKAKKIIGYDTIRESLKEDFKGKKEFLEVNLKALEVGYKYG